MTSHSNKKTTKKDQLKAEIIRVLSQCDDMMTCSQIANEIEYEVGLTFNILKPLVESGVLEKIEKGYAISDLGAIELNLTKPKPKPESVAKPKYKPMNEIKSVKSALEQTEKTPIETPAPAPIVEESVLTQIENEPIDEIETKPYPVIEDFETRIQQKNLFSELDDDSVFSPQHYNQGSIECIEALQSCMSENEYRGFLKGNAIKYLWRMNDKATPQENLKKARWYIDTLLETFE